MGKIMTSTKCQTFFDLLYNLTITKCHFGILQTFPNTADKIIIGGQYV